MEDHLVDVVLDVGPHEGIDVELVPVRRREGVDARDVADGDVVLDEHEPAAFVRRLRGCVCAKLVADRRRDHHQSTLSSISSPAQNGADRYFHPPSASTHATTE